MSWPIILGKSYSKSVRTLPCHCIYLYIAMVDVWDSNITIWYYIILRIYQVIRSFGTLEKLLLDMILLFHYKDSVFIPQKQPNKSPVSMIAEWSFLNKDHRPQFSPEAIISDKAKYIKKAQDLARDHTKSIIQQHSLSNSVVGDDVEFLNLSFLYIVSHL